MSKEKLPVPSKKSWLVWIFAPGVTVFCAMLLAGPLIEALRGDAEPHVLDGLSLIFPLFVVVVPVIGVATLTNWLFRVAWKMSVKTVLRHLCIGLFLQAILLSAGFSLKPLVAGLTSRSFSGASLGSILLLALPLYLAIPLVACELLFSGLFLGSIRIKKLPKILALISPLILTVGAYVGTLMILQARSIRQSKQFIEQRTQNREDALRNEHAFREEARAETYFGQLAERPYRVFRKTDSSYFIVDAQNTEKPLSWNTPTRDTSKNLFVDPYEGQVAYHTQEKGIAIVKPETGEIKNLTGEVLKFATTPSCGHLGGCTYFPVIAGFHNNQISLERTVYAGTANVGAFDIETGTRLVISTYAGSDSRRAYRFWVEGQGYLLLLNATDAPTSTTVLKPGGIATRTWEPIAKNMEFYLEPIPGPPHEASDTELSPPDDPFATSTSSSFSLFSVFSGEDFSAYLSAKQFIFSLPTTVIAKESPQPMDLTNYFAVGSFYKIDTDQVGLEVNNSLIVIDLSRQTAKSVTDPAEIESLLTSALLIAPDDDDLTHYGFCPEGNDTLDRQKNDGVDFESCVF